MTNLRIDMLAGHAIVSARLGVTARTIVSALHRLNGALGPQVRPRRDGARELRETTSRQIVRYIAESVLSADLHEIDDIDPGANDFQATRVSVDVLRLCDDLTSADTSVSIDDGIAVNEVLFRTVPDLEAYCWSDEPRTNQTASKGIAVVRGFIGGQVYIIRLDRLSEEDEDNRPCDWMAFFRDLVKPCLQDGVKDRRITGH